MSGTRRNFTTNSGNSSANESSLAGALLAKRSSFRDAGLGDLALDRGWITAAQLQSCQERIDRGAFDGSLADLLVRDHLLSPDRISELWSALSGTELDDAFARRQVEMHGRPFGKFILVEEIGQGGAGVVHRAWQTGLDRWVALKRLRLDSADALVRFEREGRVAGQIHHPNLVPIFETGTIEGTPYLAMACIEGGTLHAKKLPTREACDVISKIAGAVEELHRAGILHRDIKPANLLRDEAGRVYLTDFGLAREATAPRLSSAGLMLGTPAFAPPEQVLGETARVGPRSDVYGLGATLHALVTGAPPISGRDDVEVSQRALESRIEPVADATLDRIIRKAMSFAPEDRYASAGDFARDVRRFVAGEPVMAPRRSRIPKRLWVAAVLVVLVAGAAVEQGRRHRVAMNARLQRITEADEVAGWLEGVRTAERLSQESIEWATVRGAGRPAPSPDVAQAERVRLRRSLAGNPHSAVIEARFDFLLGATGSFADLSDGPVLLLNRARASLRRFLRFADVPVEVSDGMGGVSLSPGRTPTPEEEKWKRAALADVRSLRGLKNGERLFSASGLASLLSGMERLTSGDAQGAVPDLEKAAGWSEERADALELLGYAWLSLGNHEKAAAAWESAVLMRPRRADIRLFLAAALVSLAALNPDEAEALLNRAGREIDAALEMFPGSVEAILARSTVALSIARRNRTRRAELLDRAISDCQAVHEPMGLLNEATAWMMKAVEDGRAEYFGKARALYAEALARPDLNDLLRQAIHVNRAALLLQIGATDLKRSRLESAAGALRETIQAVDEAPASSFYESRMKLVRAAAGSNLAKAERLLGRPDGPIWDQAVRDVDRAIDLDPAQPRSRVLAAQIDQLRYLTATPDRILLDKALAHVVKAMELGSPAWNLRAEIYYDLGKHAGASAEARDHFLRAASDFSRALEIERTPETLLKRSQALGRAAQFIRTDPARLKDELQAALKDADEACAGRPSDAGAWYHAGLLCEQLERRRDAVERLKKARDLETADTELRARINRHFEALKSE